MATGGKTLKCSRCIKMKRFQLAFLLFLTGITPVFCSGDMPDDKTAATLFQNHQYAEALATWEKMVNNRSNAGLYFNIGLAESKLNKSMEAIYAYEQALRLRPLNTKYQKALEQERKKIDNAVIPINPFFLERWYMGWITGFRPGVWALLGFICLISAIAFYLIQIKALPWQKEIPKLINRITILVGLIFLVTAFLSFQHLYKKDEGILVQSCELRQASSAESPALRLLSAGEKVKIKDKLGEWNYVALVNLDYGWIKNDCIKAIKIADRD